MVHQQQLNFATQAHGQMLDITSAVQRAVSHSGIQRGLVHLFHVGSTGALGAIEYEPGLQDDLPRLLDRLIPPDDDYAHERTWHDDNGHSHLQATLMGPSLTVPVAEGSLVLGTWQQIILLECDTRSRQRKVFVTVMGE